MRILLIRHGDPDYVNDTLTEKGRREAALLAKRAVSMNMGECYKSPLGRAKDTATPCLEVTGKTAEILDWLQEFPAQVDLNKNPELEKAYPDVKKEGEHFLPRIAWDMVPGYWTDNVRDFIQENYTPYDGDASFLEEPTEATNKLWGNFRNFRKKNVPKAEF